MTTALVPRAVLDLEAFARATGMHPDLARRLVALGLIDATRGVGGELCFTRDQIQVAARAQRLRAGFALNYGALALVTDLLDRIADLERIAARQARTHGGAPWT